MRDSDWLLALLSDGEEHELPDIIRRSQEVRGHGLTVHSRVSDLRHDYGCVIAQRGAVRNGRRVSFYRLISVAEAASGDQRATRAAREARRLMDREDEVEKWVQAEPDDREREEAERWRAGGPVPAEPATSE